MSNINDIKDSYLCYGCGACNVICGHSAISMQYDNIGRLCPIIDESKCTDCGLCRSNCPALDSKGIQLPHSEDKYVGQVECVYIGRASEESVFRNSQSGGMVTATVKYLLESGKIDAAIMCQIEDAIEYSPKAVVITSVKDLYSCQRSSYVPIDIVSAMKDACQYNSIAIIGTGCHIQGIKALQNFGSKYKNKIKYTLGLVCDRTLCKTVTNVLYGGHFKNKKKRIVWRDKSKNYEKARLLIQNSEGVQKELPRWKRVALKDPFTNPRCRICFDKLNTGADIVFGDPWGMSNVDWLNGTSLVITRTHSGSEIIRQMMELSCAKLSEAALSEVVKGQLIEKRKKDVSAALSYYRKRGWCMPSYSDVFDIKETNPEIDYLIDRFVKDSSCSKSKIVSKNKIYLIKQYWYYSSILSFPIRAILWVKNYILYN